MTFEEIAARREALHARVVALIDQRGVFNDFQVGAKHSLAAKVWSTFFKSFALDGADGAAPTDAEISVALTPMLPKPDATDRAPRLPAPAAHAEQKAREWEANVGYPATPEQRLAWAREHADYKPEPLTGDDGTHASLNRTADIALSQWERATGRDRRSLSALDQRNIASAYAARQQHERSISVTDQLAREGREPATPAERAALAREQQEAGR